MGRVLIVAKTSMGFNSVCVGGLNLETYENIRLLTCEAHPQPIDTKFDVGQIWEVEFHKRSKVRSPHVEDVIVNKAEYITQQANLRVFLMDKVQCWEGGPENLFDGLLTSCRKSAYISEHGPAPTSSVGFWLTNVPLKQSKNPKYYTIDVDPDVWHDGGLHDEKLIVPHKGFGFSPQYVPANTLVRVSLARWYKSPGTDEEGCYLQLSGWYL